MVRTLLFDAALQNAMFATIAIADPQPTQPHPLTGPDVLPADITALDT